MNELQKYTAKVLWYSSLEYGMPPTSVKEFETSHGSNVWMDLVFNNFSSNKPFQDCAGHLIRFYKKQIGVSEDSFILEVESEANEDEL